MDSRRRRGTARRPRRPGSDCAWRRPPRSCLLRSGPGSRVSFRRLLEKDVTALLDDIQADSDVGVRLVGAGLVDLEVRLGHLVPVLVVDRALPTDVDLVALPLVDDDVDLVAVLREVGDATLEALRRRRGRRRLDDVAMAARRLV